MKVPKFAVVMPWSYERLENAETQAMMNRAMAPIVDDNWTQALTVASAGIQHTWMLDPQKECAHEHTTQKWAVVYDNAGHIRGASGRLEVCDDFGEVVAGAIQKPAPPHRIRLSREFAQVRSEDTQL